MIFGHTNEKDIIKSINRESGRRSRKSKATAYGGSKYGADRRRQRSKALFIAIIAVLFLSALIAIFVLSRLAAA